MQDVGVARLRKIDPIGKNATLVQRYTVCGFFQSKKINFPKLSISNGILSSQYGIT